MVRHVLIQVMKASAHSTKTLVAALEDPVRILPSTVASTSTKMNTITITLTNAVLVAYYGIYFEDYNSISLVDLSFLAPIAGGRSCSVWSPSRGFDF